MELRPYGKPSVYDLDGPWENVLDCGPVIRLAAVFEISKNLVAGLYIPQGKEKRRKRKRFKLRKMSAADRSTSGSGAGVRGGYGRQGDAVGVVGKFVDYRGRDYSDGGSLGARQAERGRWGDRDRDRDRRWNRGGDRDSGRDGEGKKKVLVVSGVEMRGR